MKRYALFFFAVVGVAAANAQSSILLEACNSIADSGKRLACLQELMNTRPAAAPQPDPSLERVKNAFLGLRGAVESGISYNAYAQQVIEPASALAIYRRSPKADAIAADLLGNALQAYKDAQSLWRASIYDSKDAGAFGRIFNYRHSGLEDIVKKYRLSVTTVLFNDHLPIDAALAKVWSRAKDETKAALFRLELDDPATAADASGTYEAYPLDSRNYDPPRVKPELVGAYMVSSDSPQGQIYSRTGLRLGTSVMVVLEVDPDHSGNSRFPVGSIVEAVGDQKIKTAKELAEKIDGLKKGEAGFDMTVLQNEVPKTFFLEVR